MKSASSYLSLILVLVLTLPALVFAIRAPTKPLSERVDGAEVVFVGKVINRVVDGDWVRAELFVEEPLLNTKKDQKIEVIWRATIGGRPIYDTAEGSKGVAILDDKHEGRFWLRADKFEKVEKLAEVKRLVEARDKE